MRSTPRFSAFRSPGIRRAEFQRTKEARRRRLSCERLESRRLLAASLEPAPLRPVPAPADQIASIVRTALPGQAIVAIEHFGDVDASFQQLTASLVASNESVDSITSQSVLRSGDRYDGFVEIMHLTFDPSTDLDQLINGANESLGVRWAAPNYQYTGDIHELTPNDPNFSAQYHHALMGNPLAWDVTLGDPSVIIAVTDEGVETNHPDLAANIWTNTAEVNGIDGFDDDGNGFIDDFNGWDFVANDNNPNPNVNADNHGTHVAGIAAGRINNGIQIAGTAGGSSIMPIRIAGNDGGFTSLIMANTFAYGIDNGARIMNTSFNINGFVGDPTFTAGLQYYHDNGGIHFNSAGNADELNPARQVFETTLLVASTDSQDIKSSFSNHGDGIDISAPGSSILSTLTGGTTGTQSGTSMAAPNAAGVAALIWSANPTWTRDQVVAQLFATADDLDAINPSFAGLLGSGRVNSGRAVTETIAPPQVRSVAGLPDDGSVVSTEFAFDFFSVEFDQFLSPAAVNAGTGLEVRGAGANGTFGDADDVTIPFSTDTVYQIGTNRLEFEFDAPLGPGSYQFAALSSVLVNPFGTGLDGDGDGFSGGDFTISFDVVQAPLDPIGPDPAGMLFGQGVGQIASPTQVDTLTYQFDPGQSISLVVSSDDGLIPAVELSDPTGAVLATAVSPGAGQPAIIAPTFNTVGGTYTINIAAAGGSLGSYEISVVVNGVLQESPFTGQSNASPATAQDISDAFFAFGSAESERAGIVAIGGGGLSDDFESGELNSSWTTSSSLAEGRIRVTGEQGTAAGDFALIMDRDPSGNNNLNEAIWTVNLAGVTEPTLRFSHIDLSDEDDPLPAQFTGSFDGDGVSVSEDGFTWHRILDATSPIGWEALEFDLDAVAAAAGITLGNNFQIKFQQFDNFPAPTDGRGYDEISITGTGSAISEWYRLEQTPGVPTSIGLTGAPGAVFDVFLDQPSGDPVLLASSASVDNLTASVDRLIVPSGGATDDLLVSVRATGAYEILVARDASIDIEANDDFETAQASGSTFGSLESTVLADTNLLTDFAGINANDAFCGCQPPDTHVAVGVNHVVEVVNTAVEVYNKDGSVAVPSQALTSFFSPAVVQGETFSFDPVVTYMEDVDRFVVAVLIGATAGAAETDLLIAISDSGDASGTWTEQHRIDFGGISPGLFADYPKVGWNADSLVFTLNMFGGGFVDVNLVSIEIASLLDANASTFTSFLSERPGTSFTMAAATMHDSTPGGPMWLVEESGFGGTRNDIRVVRMDNALSNNPTFTDFLVPVSTYTSGENPLAPQPGGTRVTNDARILNSEWRDDRLVATHTAGIGGEATVRWYEFDTSAASPALAQQGVIDGGPGTATFFPSIAINQAGDIGLTYMQSSATEFSSMYVTGQAFGGAAGVTGTPVLARAGDQTFPGSRSGDYSGIAVDPIADTFWAANEVSLSGAPDPLWSTHIAEFSVSATEDVDVYEFVATAGDPLVLTTATPHTGPDQPDNGLNPILRLFGPDGSLIAVSDQNSAGNGIDETITLQAPTSGLYRVEVSDAAGNRGRYLIDVTGATGIEANPQIVASTPTDGAVLSGLPESVVLDFSEAVSIASIQAGDVLIGGLPAIDFAVIDGDTVAFTPDPAAQVGDGSYAVGVPANSILDLQGQPFDAFASQFVIDSQGPQIVSTSWNGASLPVDRRFAGGPLVFEADFSEPLFTLRSARTGLRLPGTGDVELLDTVTGEITNPNTVTFDPVTLAFSATFDFLPEGNYALRLISQDGGFEDQVGNDLDGEFQVGSNDGTVTGDGTPGGDYVVEFTVDALTARSVAPFERVAPLGSLIGVSEPNLVLLDSALDTDEFEFSALAGEFVTVVATPQNPSAVIGIDSASLTDGLVSAAGPGAPLVLSSVEIPSDGIHGLVFSTSEATMVDLQIILNGQSELAVGDSSPAAPLTLQPSFAPQGTTRYAVIGQTDVSTAELINNGGFESGDFTGWTATDNGLSQLTPWTVGGPGGGFFSSSDPLSGSFSAFNGFDGAAGATYDLFQDVTLPAGPATLTTNHRIRFDGFGIASTQDRTFEITVRDLSGTVLESLFTETITLNGASDTDLGWNEQSFDLSAFAGQSVRIQFSQTIPEANSGPAIIQFDDISVMASSGNADVDSYQVDLTGKVGQAVDVLLTGSESSLSGQTFELIGPDGTSVLATGTADPVGQGNAQPYDLGVLGFVVPQDGIYTVRVASNVNGEYSLMVTESLAFESGPNRDTDLIGAAIGYVAPASTAGEYTVTDIPIGFEDIAGTGISVFLGDDQVSGPIPFGFDFTFFENIETDVRISSNGFLTFDDNSGSGCCSGLVIPSSDGTNNLIAGWWEDLNPSVGGTIHHQNLGSGADDRTIIQFTDVPHFGGGNLVTMQFKLFATGVIEVHYVSAPSDGGTHSAGIENADGTLGFQHAFGNQSLPANSAVQYAPLVPSLSDRFTTFLQAGQTETFTLQSLAPQSSLSPTATLDPLINIIHPDGSTIVATDDNSLGGVDAVVTFTAPIAGSYTIEVVAQSGEGEYLLRRPLPPDTTAPHVLDVIVASSDWTPEFIDTLDGPGAGNGLGLSMPGGSQMRSLPWTSGIDTIYIVFNEDVSASFTGEHMRLQGGHTADHMVGTAIEFGPGNIGKLTLPAAITNESFMLTLFDTLADETGNRLDGEWSDETSLTSGDGTALGQFDFRFEVLAGDVNDSRAVNVSGDVLAVFGQNTMVPSNADEARFDVNASGAVNVSGDVLAVFARNTQALPDMPSSPTPPGSGSAEFGSPRTALIPIDRSLSAKNSGFRVIDAAINSFVDDERRRRLF